MAGFALALQRRADTARTALSVLTMGKTEPTTLSYVYKS